MGSKSPMGKRQLIGAVLEGGERVDRQGGGRVHGQELTLELSAVTLLEVAHEVPRPNPRNQIALGVGDMARRREGHAGPRGFELLPQSGDGETLQ